MNKIRKITFCLALSILVTAIIPGRLYPQTQSPTIVFYAAYIFEAKSNGDKLEFPLMPGETAIATLDNFSETAPGYIEKLRSIYSFQHFSLLGMLGGSLSIDLRRGDGRAETVTLLGAKKHTRWEPPSQTADNQLIFHSFFLSIISGMPVAQCGRNWH